MGSWTIGHMGIAKNSLGRLTNYELPIESKVKEIIFVV